MEPDVSIETSSMIRIAVIPMDNIHLHLFRKYAAMLSHNHNKIPLSTISSFYTEHQKSPFSQQPWDSGSLRFKFIVGGSALSPWEDFQSNRKIHAVIGICHCPSSPDLDSVAHQFAVACKGYSSAVVHRCFAFSPCDTQLGTHQWYQSHDPMETRKRTNVEFQQETDERFARHDTLIERILTELQTFIVSLQSLKSSGSLEGGGSITKVDHKPYLKLQFPRFGGGESAGWLYQAEQYFEFQRVNDSDKVHLASFHLVGIALQWHRWLSKAKA